MTGCDVLSSLTLLVFWRVLLVRPWFCLHRPAILPDNDFEGWWWHHLWQGWWDLASACFSRSCMIHQPVMQDGMPLKGWKWDSHLDKFVRTEAHRFRFFFVFCSCQTPVLQGHHFYSSHSDSVHHVKEVCDSDRAEHTVPLRTFNFSFKA